MDRKVSQVFVAWRARVVDTAPAGVVGPALEEAVSGLVNGFAATPFRADVGAAVGTELIAANFLDPIVLDLTAALVGELPGLVGPDVSDPVARVAALVGAVGRGYAQALWRRSASAVVPVRSRPAGVVPRGREVDLRFELVFNHASLPIAVGDAAGRIVYVNPALAVILGKGARELIGTSVGDQVDPQDRAHVVDEYMAVASAGARTKRVECRFTRGDGEPGVGTLTLTSVRAASGPGYVLGVWEDSTGRRRMQDQLRRLALHDHLTGLPNRAYMIDTLERALDARTRSRIGALIYCAVDGFKQINDEQGRAAGDFAVTGTAFRIQQAVGDDGLLARMGGGLFAVAVAGPATGDRVRTLVDRIHLSLAQPIPTADGGTYVPRATIGVTMIRPRDRRTADEVLDDADADRFHLRDRGSY